MTSSNGNIFCVTGPLCGSVNNREAGDFRCHCGHYDVTVMFANMMTNCNRILQVRPYENHIIFPDTLYPSSLLHCHQNSEDSPSTNEAALKNMGKYSRYVLTMYDHSKAKLKKPRSYFTSWKIHNVFIYHRLWLWSKTSLNARRDVWFHVLIATCHLKTRIKKKTPHTPPASTESETRGRPAPVWNKVVEITNLGAAAKWKVVALTIFSSSVSAYLAFVWVFLSLRTVPLPCDRRRPWPSLFSVAGCRSTHWGQMTHICVEKWPGLVQTMAWRLESAKPFSEPIQECC